MVLDKLEIISRKGNELVVKLVDCMSMDSRIVDGTGTNVGKLVRVMGPVSAPYGLVRLQQNDFRGAELFIRC